MTLLNKHIAIAGGGLIGSLLSIYLVKRGYEVSIFERRPDIRDSPPEKGRSINLALSDRGLRALEEIGMRELVGDLAIPMHGRMMHDRQGALTFLPYGKQGQFINSISRSALNIALLNKAEEMGVNMYFEHRCRKINVQKTEMQFEYTDKQVPAGRTRRSSKARGRLKFDIIAGADGAFSSVRSIMQVTDRFNYSQQYIEHGYKELTIPAGHGSSLEKNALHIWPRDSFMMIALPNTDGSFTCTLFLPFEGSSSFQELKRDESIKKFFHETFPDAVTNMPALTTQFRQNPLSSLVTIQCAPWVQHRTFLIGDAAHAIVPFFGQGMNAGFEDCRILNQLLNEHDDNWELALKAFQSLRIPDTQAIARLALDNFIEMRDLVANQDFLLRKKIEARLHDLYPDKWIPLYSMVTFNSSIRYSEALEIGQRQKRIMDEVMQRPGIHDEWQQLNFEKIASALYS